MGQSYRLTHYLFLIIMDIDTEQCINDFISFGPLTENIPPSSHGKPEFCGVYLIKHLKSGMLYVGSTKDLYRRIVGHCGDLRGNKHPTIAFQQKYNDDPRISIFSIITNNRDDATNREQEILDKYFNTGILFNKAIDAKFSTKGIERTNETKLKLRNANLGKKMSSKIKEKIRNKMLGRKFSESSIEKLKNSGRKQYKAVSIDGAIYESMHAAADTLKISLGKIHHRLRSKYHKSWFLC